MKKILFLITILGIGIIFYSFQYYTAKVSKCIDGDSFYLITGKEIRLAEVDAPEATNGHIQAYGLKATSFAEKYLLGKFVTLVKKDVDKYGRQVCEVYVNGIWFNQLLVDSGYAWVYKKYGSAKLYNEELQAKKNRIGLWADPHPIPPYIFRKNEKIIKP